MPHYVLIDNYSGYVWGEADADDPIEACAIVDRQTGGDPREYEEQMIGNSSTSGYFVYEAPADWRPVDDGQSQDEIERVTALPLVAEVVCGTAE